MIEKNELLYIRSQLTFWENLNESEIELIEKNISKVSYSKGYNLHSTDSECLGVLLIKMTAYCLFYQASKFVLINNMNHSSGLC